MLVSFVTCSKMNATIYTQYVLGIRIYTLHSSAYTMRIIVIIMMTIIVTAFEKKINNVHIQLCTTILSAHYIIIIIIINVINNAQHNNTDRFYLYFFSSLLLYHSVVVEQMTFRHDMNILGIFIQYSTYNIDELMYKSSIDLLCIRQHYACFFHYPILYVKISVHI